MFRKDFISNEIDKLAKVLARVIGLKESHNHEEADELIAETLNEQFEFQSEYFDTVEADEFEVFLQKQNYPERKLDLLAQILFESAHPFTEDGETINRLHLILVVFNHLEKQYHTQSLENITRIEMIENFLSNRQYE